MAEVYVLYVVLELLIAAACCLGNVLVVLGVKLSHSLRQPTFCFITSLAVADFLVGAVAIPLALVLDYGWHMSFDGCLFIACIVVVLTQSSVFALLAIAVDRYLRVRMALRYKRIATQSRSWAAVIVSWVIACLLGFVPLFGWNTNKRPQPPNSTINCNFIEVVSMEYMVYFNFFVCILLPLVIMTVLYLLVFHNIKRHIQNKESTTFYKKEQKLAQSLALVLTLFALGWLPLHIMNCLTYFRGSDAVHIRVVHAGILLSHGNSAVNPIVYAFKIPKLRRAYLHIWRRVAFCQNDDSSQSDPSVDQLDTSNPNSSIQTQKSKIKSTGMGGGCNS